MKLNAADGSMFSAKNKSFDFISGLVCIKGAEILKCWTITNNLLLKAVGKSKNFSLHSIFLLPWFLMLYDYHSREHILVKMAIDSSSWGAMGKKAR